MPHVGVFLKAKFIIALIFNLLQISCILKTPNIASLLGFHQEPLVIENNLSENTDWEEDKDIG